MENNNNYLEKEMIETISLIKDKQKYLDSLIHLKKNFSFSQTFNLRKLALLVELGEFSNELESFKFWKINKKEKDENKVKEELIDCLHFFISIINDLNVSIDLDSKEDYGCFDLNELLLKIFESTTYFSLNMKNSHSICNNWLRLFLEICNNLQLSSDELLSSYLQKNKLNIERLNSGY
ncbi:MAG: hypothetical protein AD073_000214 [Mycoplasmataceae bacterium]|nr:MAG: hypothetical protein AD073_000214 [Mycoplasmataceae bacterium]